MAMTVEFAWPWCAQHGNTRYVRVFGAPWGVRLCRDHMRRPTRS
jgi:hypothetical protein